MTRRRDALRLALGWLATGLTASLASGPAAAAPRVLAAGLGSGADDGVFPRTVRHAFGATQLARRPLRVAVVSTGQADAMLTLGLVPAGATRDDGGALYGAYLRQAYPGQAGALARTADLGGRSAPDIEALAALKPDLILMNRAVLRENVYALYSRIAPTVVTRGNGLNWKIDFLLLADALGRRQQAQAWLARFHADAQAFAARLPAQGRPQVSFLQFNAARIRILGRASFAGGIAQDLGLPRPPSQQFHKNAQILSTELLDQADGDFLFYATRGQGLARSPLWPRLQAVRRGRAREVDTDAFYLNAGPTAARSVLDTLVQTVAPTILSSSAP